MIVGQISEHAAVTVHAHQARDYARHCRRELLELTLSFPALSCAKWHKWVPYPSAAKYPLVSPPVASSSSLLDRHTIFLRSCFRCAGARTCVWVYVCSYTCKSYGPQHSSVLGHWGATGSLTARTKVSSSVYGACTSPPPDIASWYRCVCVCVCVSQCPSVSRS